MPWNSLITTKKYQVVKKLILTTALLVGIVSGAAAQNRSIDFLETKVWKEITEKARKENKLIFIDCYTDWCGPCKMLASNVFTQDKVADFFNENFVNAKFEMEKDADGIAHKDAWNIKAYPTLVFVDPNTDEVIHSLVGAGNADWLIEGGKVAMDPSNNLNGMNARYDKGDRSPEFILAYLKALKSAYIADKQQAVAMAYLDNLTVDQLATPENWLVIRDNVSDPLSKPLRQVMANRQKFYGIAGLDKQSVDRFLTGSVNNAAVALARWQPGHGQFDQTRYDELMNYLKEVDYPEKKPAMEWMETSEFVRNGDWKGLEAKMKKVEKSKVLNDREFNSYYQYFIETIGGSGDDAVIDRAVKDLDKRIAKVKGDDSSAWFAKAGYADSKHRILKRAGRELAADNAKLETEDYNNKGREASGGRVVPAIRMG